MWMREREFTVKLGGTIFVNVENIVAFQNEPLFTVYRSEADGSIGINFEVYDANSNHLASVRQNRIYRHREQAANLVIGGDADTYTLTNANGAELVRIIRGPAAQTELDVFLRTYLPNGVLFEATPNGSSIANLFMEGVTLENASTGVNIG